MAQARSTPGLLGVLLCFSALSVWAASDREGIESRLAEVRSEIAGLQHDIDHNLGQRDSLLSALAEAERSVGQARRAQALADQRLTEVREQIGGLETRQKALESEVSEHAAELARHLATAYRQGTPSRLKTLLNQDDPRRLSRRMAYHGYLSRARLAIIEELFATVEELAATHRRLADEAAQQAELLEQHRLETRRLESAMAERAAALSALDQRLLTDRERLARLEVDAEDLARLLDELAGLLADVPPDVAIPAFAELRGELPLPVDGRLVYAYGQQRSAELEWTGWMFSVAEGTPVSAIAHGRVAYADWLRGYGLLLIIDHGDGYMSLYAHNEALMRDVGDWVAPGERIALTGKSGGVGSASLYFELRQDGRPVDPAGWLVR